MPTPTHDEIKEHATGLFKSDVARRGTFGEGEPGPEPEEDELKEDGYWETARKELMSAGARLSPEEKEKVTARKYELELELGELYEALGERRKRARPRYKAEESGMTLSVEPIRVAVGAQAEDLAKGGKVTAAERKQLEDAVEALAALPYTKHEKKQHFPGKPVPALAAQKQPQQTLRSRFEDLGERGGKAGAKIAKRALKAAEQRINERLASYQKTREEQGAAKAKLAEELRTLKQQLEAEEAKEVLKAEITARKTGKIAAVQARAQQKVQKRAEAGGKGFTRLFFGGVGSLLERATRPEGAPPKAKGGTAPKAKAKARPAALTSGAQVIYIGTPPPVKEAKAERMEE